MQCLSPISIPYVVNGQKTRSYHLVPCGKCYACREAVQNDWIFRLKQELKNAKQAHFVTFTYDPEHVPLKDVQELRYDNISGEPYTVSVGSCLTVKKKDVQNYLKRLRKRLEPESLRYYAVSEYGSEGLRPHYHILFFYSGNQDIRNIYGKDWPYGFIYVGSVTDASISYVTKYVFKDGKQPPGSDPTFALSSRRPAIGLSYLSQPGIEDYHTSQAADHSFEHVFLTSPGGFKQRLPRYYRGKLGVFAPPLVKAPWLPAWRDFRQKYPDATFLDFLSICDKDILQSDPEQAIIQQKRIDAYIINKQNRKKRNSKL